MGIGLIQKIKEKARVTTVSVEKFPLHIQTLIYAPLITKLLDSDYFQDHKRKRNTFEILNQLTYEERIAIINLPQLSRKVAKSHITAFKKCYILLPSIINEQLKTKLEQLKNICIK